MSLSLVNFFSNLGVSNEIDDRYINNIKDLSKNSIKILTLIPNFFSMFKLHLEKGMRSWEAPKAFRQKYDALYKDHVESVWKDFLVNKPKGKVLELGAGFLNEDNNSYLSSSFPAGAINVKNIIFSDISIEAVKAARNNNYFHIDSAKLSKTFAPAQFSSVISSCFLDTLDDDDLKATLTEIHKFMMDDGYFFHISDLEPWFNTLLFAYKTSDKVVFPLVTKEMFIEGLQLLDRSVCKDFITAHSNSNDPQLKREAQFLSFYINLSNDERTGLILDISQKFMSFPISDFVKTRFADQRVEILNEDFFKNRIQKAVEKSKFEVMKCGLVTKQRLEKIEKEFYDPEYNDFSSLHGRCTQEKIDLEPLTVRKTSWVHIIVLKKSVKK